MTLFVVLLLPAALIALVVVYVAFRKVRDQLRGWRIRYQAEYLWAYEEKRDGVWAGVSFQQVGDFRERPRVVYVYGAERWKTFPEWIANRREEILARLRSEMCPPQYFIEEGEPDDRPNAP